MQIKGAAQQLADYMTQLSQKYYGKTWEFGLEYELWQEIAVEADQLEYDEIMKLKELKDWCGGWIVSEIKGGEESLTFLLLDDWCREFEKNKPF